MEENKLPNLLHPRHAHHLTIFRRCSMINVSEKNGRKLKFPKFFYGVAGAGCPWWCGEECDKPSMLRVGLSNRSAVSKCRILQELFEGFLCFLGYLRRIHRLKFRPFKHTSNRPTFHASQARFHGNSHNSGKIYVLSHLTKCKIVPLVLLNMICTSWFQAAHPCQTDCLGH